MKTFEFQRFSHSWHSIGQWQVVIKDYLNFRRTHSNYSILSIRIPLTLISRCHMYSIKFISFNEAQSTLLPSTSSHCPCTTPSPSQSILYFWLYITRPLLLYVFYYLFHSLHQFFVLRPFVSFLNVFHIPANAIWTRKTSTIATTTTTAINVPPPRSIHVHSDTYSWLTVLHC